MASIDQLTALIDYLEAHKELALGRLTRTKEGRSQTKRLWAECAAIINSISSNCVPKTPDQWRVYYNEYKSKLLKKIKLEKAEMGATGGGPSRHVPLTPLQERLYNILGRDVGEPLPGIRHDPFSQLDHCLVGSVVVEDTQLLEEDNIVVEVSENYSQAPLQDISNLVTPSLPQTGTTIETSREFTTGATAGTSMEECTIGLTPATSREFTMGATAGTSRECPSPCVSRVTTDPIRPTRPVPRRRRRRRRSPVSQGNQASENEPNMREATERLENMERLNAEATHELARATHRQAAALEAIARGIQGFLEINERRRSPRRFRRFRAISSDSE